MFGTNQLFIIAIGVILIILVYWFFNKRPKAQRKESDSQEIPPEEIETGMKKMAAQTVEFAKTHFNITLDYSEESINEMETMYEQMYKDIKKLRMPKKEIADLALIQGAYIGEVIRKHHGGHWEKDHKALGQNSWPIIFDEDNATCPVGWVFKRLTNGKEDDVSYKYRVLITNRDDK